MTIYQKPSFDDRVGAAGDRGGGGVGEHQNDRESSKQPWNDHASSVDRGDDRMSTVERRHDQSPADVHSADRDPPVPCRGFMYKIPGMTLGNLGYPFALHSKMHLPWTNKGEASTFSLFATSTRTSTGCTGATSPDGGPCTPCGGLAFNTSLRGTWYAT